MTEWPDYRMSGFPDCSVPGGGGSQLPPGARAHPRFPIWLFLRGFLESVDARLPAERATIAPQATLSRPMLASHTVRRLAHAGEGLASGGRPQPTAHSVWLLEV